MAGLAVRGASATRFRLSSDITFWISATVFLIEGRNNIQLTKKTAVTKLRISSLGNAEREGWREETATGRNSLNSSTSFRGATFGFALIVCPPAALDIQQQRPACSRPPHYAFLLWLLQPPLH